MSYQKLWLPHLYIMESNKWVQRWVGKVFGVKSIRILVETFFFYQFCRSTPSFVKPLG